jgi:hypothetical protein
LTPAHGFDIVCGMRYTVTCEDLSWLEQEGYWVDPTPDVLPDGRRFYQIDGVSCSEEQIIRHLTEAKPLHENLTD